MTALTDSLGTITQSYTYDAFGNQLNENENDINPFRYCGEYFDNETGSIYLRNRYYDTAIGRFTTEDPHWNVDNMIYGKYMTYPDISAVIQSSNLYAYTMNNPIIYVDYTGEVSEKIAAQRIKDNASYIISAGQEFGVNPAILAATIYAEQVRNVNYTEGVEDYTQALLGIDCSVGISQVRITTAIKLEDAGYIEKTYSSTHITSLFINPFNGKSVYATENISRESNIYDKLISDRINIRYAAAYLSMIQDIWKDSYSEIDGRTAILATLYNIGEMGGKRGINSNPQSTPFGDFAKENYYNMQNLLGLN